MFNPFLQLPPQKTGNSRSEMNEELVAQFEAQLVKNPSTRNNIGLWAGNLLIKMGKKLAEQDIDLTTSKEHA